MMRRVCLLFVVFLIATSCYGGKPTQLKKKVVRQNKSVQKKVSLKKINALKKKVVRRAMKKITFSGFDLNTDEKIVAMTIIAEAKGEGLLGMYGVACVAKQRMLNRKMIPSDVCLQWKQFSCWNNWNDKNSAKLAQLTLKDVPQSTIDYAILLSRWLVSGGDFDRSFIGYSDHYCRTDISPDWAKGVSPLAVVGNHKYYDL